MHLFLKEACHTGEIVSFYTNREQTDRFSSGRIKMYNNTQVLIELIDPYGNDDGLSVNFLSNIFLLEQGTNYNTKLNRLSRLKGEKDRVDAIGYLEADLITYLLRFAKDNEYVLTVQLCESGFTDAVGFVERLSENEVDLRLVDELGHLNGKSVFAISDITSITCDSQDERALKLLYQNL